MADSGIFGKTLMGQRPDSNNGDDLDELDYFFYSENDPGDVEEKSDENVDESFSGQENIPADGDDIEVLEDAAVEYFHTENINPDGSIKEFDLYDGELPLDLEVGTSTAAKSLGCTEQTIRNYCKDFQEFLDIRVVNGRRKLTIKTLRKLDSIMHIKEERKYDRDQMRAFLRNDGREALAVTEEERLQFLSEMVSKRVVGDLVDKFKEDDGILSQLSDQINQQIQSSFEQLNKKEDEIKTLMDQLSSQKKSDDDNDRMRLKELEERLDAAQKEVSDFAAISRQKDEEIAKLQADIEQLKENSNKKKRFLFFK